KPIRPPRLKPGDTIGIVAPASPFDQDIFNQGLNILESMGFRTVVPDEVFEKNGYLAGSDAHRAKLVARLFKDPNVNAIVCAKGGFGCLRILPLLDFDVMRENPKVFIGHSDITALLAAITAKSELVTFHGPVVTTLAEAPEFTRQSLLAAISSDTHLKVTSGKGVTIKAGRAQGPIIGGNLTTLCHLLGTPFEPRFENHILLLEDRGEAHYRIDRMLFQMKLAGCFEGIAGLVLGSFENCGSLDGIYKIFQEHFQDIPVPILAGFDMGHGEQNLTIPFGLDATLDSDQQILSFDQPATV
ncbi:MAG: LD-carboxypeptidase, partial [Desulfobacterales bacterium]|nr:LD-carboxypeptidase [Desulfobacterales bacterium]